MHPLINISGPRGPAAALASFSPHHELRMLAPPSVRRRSMVIPYVITWRPHWPCPARLSGEFTAP
jgi:hypothetical protein